MRVLLTIPNFRTAGSQHVVLNLYKGLQEKGIETKVLVFDKNVVCSEIEKKDILSVDVAQESISIKTILFIVKYAWILIKNKIDVVHSWDYRSQAWEVYASKLVGVAFLFTKKNSAWSSSWLRKSRLATHIAYDNPKMKNSFFGGERFESKTSLIPHGINLDSFSFTPREKPQARFKIGVVGVIDQNKNQIVVLKALTILGIDYEVHFYGKGQDVMKQKLQTYVKNKNLDNQVYFHGYVENAQLGQVLSGLDVVVLPSFMEGLPVTLIEAMATGIPCIASNSGGGNAYILKSG